MNKLKCKICNREFKNYKGISQHISKGHKINIKDYYDLYFKKNDENICNHSACKNICSFANINYGYFKYCSVSCKNKSTEGRAVSSESSINLWNDPNSSFHSKNRSNKLKQALKNKWNEKNSIFRTKEYTKKKSDSIKKLRKDPNSQYNTDDYRNKRKRIMKKLTNDPHSSYNTMACRQKRSKSIKKSYKNNPELLKQRCEILVFNRYNCKKLGKISKPQMQLFKLCSFLLPYPVLEYPCCGKNIDIAIPQLSLAFEYDECYWHKDKEADNIRQKLLENEGWIFIRYSKLPDIKQLLSDVNEVLI